MPANIAPDDLLALLKSRRSIRRYRPDPVPEEALQQVLDAGRWAPSASNRQPWSFVVVRDPAIRQQVAQHAAFFFIRWAQVGEAPVVIALCGDVRNPAYRTFLHEDLGLAGAQMMLQAKALGLGTCWVGGLDRQAIAAILRLPPDVELVGLITLGYPAEDPPAPARKPLAQFVHYDVYGNRAPAAQVQAGKVATGPLGILLRRFRLPVRF
jgi:nitroreductase